MNERDLYARVAKELNNPAAIAALEIGGNVGRFAKIQDSWGKDKYGDPVRMFNHIDFLWTTDCLELKAVKAKTRRGLTYKCKELHGKQLKYMREHNALFGVGFILLGQDPRLICIPFLRFWKVDRLGPLEETVLSMAELEKMSDYMIEGEAYGKI